MLIYLISALALLALFAFYYLYYRPKKACETLAHNLRHLGYKVYFNDFKFLGHTGLSKVNDDRRKHNDATYTQTH